MICEWRDGSLDGWSDWSSSATDSLTVSIIESPRSEFTSPNDRLYNLIDFVDDQGGLYFGLGLIPFGVMLFGFMAGKKTVRIFTLITLFLMGIIHASGYFIYPDWYWYLSFIFGIVLIMGRMRSD